jgi:hypothetical protein
MADPNRTGGPTSTSDPTATAVNGGGDGGKDDGSAPAEPAYIGKLDYQLEALINEYGNSMRHHRIYASWFKVFEGLLTAITTVLVGVSSSRILETNSRVITYFSIGAMVTSALATFAIGLENFLGCRTNWIRYANTWSSLRMLNGQFQRKKAQGLITKSCAYEIAGSFDKILAESNADWLKSQIKEESDQKTG